jgi:hypothetical protein
MSKKGKELTEQRKQDNAAILAVLAQYLEANPDMRFSQALRNLGIVIDPDFHMGSSWVNEYYAEPGEILKRMKE